MPFDELQIEIDLDGLRTMYSMSDFESPSERRDMMRTIRKLELIQDRVEVDMTTGKKEFDRLGLPKLIKKNPIHPKTKQVITKPERDAIYDSLKTKIDIWLGR